jgi:surfeit locus 1 family protein
MRAVCWIRVRAAIRRAVNEMYFRPLPKFTAFCVPLFVALVALGVWQLERLQWKLGLIAEMNSHLHAQPISFEKAMRLPPNQAQYRRVAIAGRYDNRKEAYVFTTDKSGFPVYHVIVPFALDDGRVLLVDRGLIPLRLIDRNLRRQGLLEGKQRLVGVWRTPDAPGLFTPKPDVTHRIWYARDLDGMGHTLGIKPAAPVIVEADAAPVPGGWPKGGQTIVALRNDHLQYAVTWFLLAASLVVVYFAYHHSRGRLGFRR